MTTIIHSANELVIGSHSDTVENTLQTISDGAIVIENETIVAVGNTPTVVEEHPPSECQTVIDASGQCVLPGFVDPHTHALFVGDRSDEYEAKLQGKTYQEILASGGGILRTVKSVRNASKQDLLDQLLYHLDQFAAHGTTVVEVKSGYGLSVEAEQKMLTVIDQADARHPLDIVPTFMGAHAVPEEQQQEQYVEQVCTEQLPAIASQGIAEFCDVFCDTGAFTADQARRILAKARLHELVPKLHIDEFERRGGATVAAEIGAASADHLLRSTHADAEKLLSSAVTPVMLPATAFSIGEDYADASLFLSQGEIPALATDFNPNCYSLSQQFTTTLACSGMGITPAEAILGITEQAAAALNRSQSYGRLEPGWVGDAVIIDRPSYRHLPYTFDVNIVDTVVKRGEPIVS